MPSAAHESVESARAKILSPRQGKAWSRSGLSGRLVEISSAGAPSALTAAFGLVLDAQRQGEPTAWVTAEGSSFFPPDAAEGGIDLCSLAVVRVPDPRSALRAADKLIRSGAFGLVVIDHAAHGESGLRSPRARGPLKRSQKTWGTGAEIPDKALARLLGLARKHDTAVVLLTEKRAEAPSLSSLVSLRGEARRATLRSPGEVGREGRYTVETRILKDKRRAPGWTHAEICRGPAGLR